MAKRPANSTLREEPQISAAEMGLKISNRQLLERFIVEGDNAAFDGLVDRFGGVVWRVCRRLLQQDQDAEDAFQAVFLTLARKAPSIRNREGVGSWLYGVAFRTARKARQAVWRRRELTAHAKPPGTEPAACDAAALSEMQRLLDEEVLRLSDKYRVPFVLCCLEGMSKSEAAEELGLKEGTISGRLARARKLLHKRLVRRGVTLSAVLTALALTQQSVTAALPAILLESTAAAVLAYENGAEEAALSEHTIELANAYKDPATWTMPSLALALFLALLFLGGGTSLALYLWQLTTDAGPPPVVVEPETFVPPAVALGTPIGEQVLGLAFSPDGKRLVTTGAMNTLPGQLKAWDVASKQELFSIQRIPGVRTVAFAPDGQSIVTGDVNGDITLRDPNSGVELAKEPGHAIRVNSLSFSPDSALIASAGFDRTAKIWSARGLKELQVFRGHTEVVSSVRFLHNGAALLTGSQDGTAKLWDIATGKDKFTLVGHKAGVEAIAVSADDKYLATASSDQTVRLWDTTSGQEIAVFKGNTEQAFFAVAFSADGKILAGAGSDGTISLWDVASKQDVGTLGKHKQAVWSLAFSSTGILASGSADRTVKLWSLGGNKELANLETSWSASRPVLAVAYPSDGKVLAVATKDPAVHIRDAGSGDVIKVLSGHTAEPTCLAFSPDGLTLASGSEDKTIRIWNRYSGTEIRTLQGHAEPVRALAFSKTLLASGGDDKIIRLWDPATGKSLGSLPGHEAAIRALAISPDGQTLASGGADRVIKVWDLVKKTEISTLKGHQGTVRALAFSSDQALASAGEDGKIILWRQAKEANRLTLAGHTGAVWALAYSPQGRTLVSAGADATVRVWDPTTGQARGILTDHKGPVTALAIHPHGQNLVSGSLDTLLLRWQSAKFEPKYLPLVGGKNAEPVPTILPAIQVAPKALNAVQDVVGQEGARIIQEPKINAPQRFFQSFKGLTRPIPGWYFNGPDAENFVKWEPEGVRLTLPSGNPGPTPTLGINTSMPVKGDFEVTVGYEILTEPSPADAGKDQTRFTLDVVLVGPQSDAATLSRRISSWGGNQFYAWLRKWEPASGTKKQQGKEMPAQAKTGRLRIMRAGDEIFYFVSEAAEQGFRFVAKFPFSLDDINTFRIVGITGGPKAELDVRFTEMLIRAESLPNAAPPTVANSPQQAATNPPPPNSSLSLVLLLGLIITLLAAGGLWFLFHRRQRPETAVSASPAANEKIKATSIEFTCHGCGKTLKARAGLAGKRVKCPRCELALLVPAPCKVV